MPIAYQYGDLTGRSTLYHSTPTKNVSSILENGLKSNYANGPDTITRVVLNEVPTIKDHLADKVYLTRDSSFADAVGKAYRIHHPDESQTILKLRMPLKDFKLVDNPEALGAKTSKEYVDTFSKITNHPFEAEERGRFFTDLAINTITVEGNVPSKYITKSKYYVKESWPEIKAFIKSNPKTFAKGVGKMGVSAGLIGAGVYALKKVNDKYKEEEVIDG